jgi:DNA-damage-inducible protein D
MAKEIKLTGRVKIDATFEDIKHTDGDNVYWTARELQVALKYTKWENFHKVIKTAMIACKISQQSVADHFVEDIKVVEIGGRVGKLDFPEVGKTKQRTKKIKDYKLTRYACYLIVMNGDPRKHIIANGQTYFAVKTRQQELNELYNQLTEDDKRLFLRGDIKQKNMLLAEAAKNAGIITGLEYAQFQDAGYRGLYNGETAKDIAERKGIDPVKDEILDYMGSLELAANLFRIAQTEHIMGRENISTPNKANETHYRVGKAVRQTMENLGAEMPEQLPTPEKSIPQIEKAKYRQIKGK